MQSLYVAWLYLRFNAFRTATIVICVTVVLSLPVVLKLVVREAGEQLRARAATTPLIVGEAGSAMDLVLSSLYFTEHAPRPLTMEALQGILDTGLAAAIPVYRRFSAEGIPIVGTALDYFSFRELTLEQGRPFLYLGECVLGAAAASELGLQAGDALYSSAENAFDLAGNYPLKMTVAGVLRPAHSPDDRAVFVDVKTSWVIAGLGHGHEDLQSAADPGVILQRDEATVRANAKLLQYNEITPENRDSFHFHGDAANFPLSAIIAVSRDARSATLLKGRFVGSTNRQQIVDPRAVVELLLERIFEIKKMIDGVTWLVTAVTVLALILVFALSMRLREAEFQTLFKLGCIRSAIARLLAAEIALVLGASLLFSGTLVAAAWPWFGRMTRWLMFT
jgi:putative ABC transport system permease protein